jgi:hypothetical protein
MRFYRISSYARNPPSEPTVIYIMQPSPPGGGGDVGPSHMSDIRHVSFASQRLVDFNLW